MLLLLGGFLAEEAASGGSVWPERPAGRLETRQWGKGGHGNRETHFDGHILEMVDRIQEMHTIDCLVSASIGAVGNAN